MPGYRAYVIQVRQGWPRRRFRSRSLQRFDSMLDGGAGVSCGFFLRSGLDILVLLFTFWPALITSSSPFALAALMSFDASLQESYIIDTAPFPAHHPLLPLLCKPICPISLHIQYSRNWNFDAAPEIYKFTYSERDCRTCVSSLFWSLMGFSIGRSDEMVQQSCRKECWNPICPHSCRKVRQSQNEQATAPSLSRGARKNVSRKRYWERPFITR